MKSLVSAGAYYFISLPWEVPPCAFFDSCVKTSGPLLFLIPIVDQSVDTLFGVVGSFKNGMKA